MDEAHGVSQAGEAASEGDRGWRGDAAAERATREAAQSGDAYEELLAEGMRYGSQQDWRRAARAYREAIALRPDESLAYYNLGTALNNSTRYVEAAQRLLEAQERCGVGSQAWAQSTALAFISLVGDECVEVAKPEWWNDEALKALSASVVRVLPDDGLANNMRALVLRGQDDAWEAGPRSAAELWEAATHFDRAAALQPAPAGKTDLAGAAAQCRIQAIRRS